MANYEDENLNIQSQQEEKTYDNVEDLLADFKTMAVPTVVEVPTAEDYVTDETLAAQMQDEISAAIEEPALEFTQEVYVPKAEEEVEEEAPVQSEEEPLQSEEPKNVPPKKKGKKGKKKRKHRKKHPIVTILILLLIAFGVYKFALSDFFTVTDIEVEGNKHYTVAQIVEMSKITVGHNLFETDTSEGKDVLLQDPYIRLVSIKKVPRGTIKIIVEEREEYAAVPYGNEYILIDNTGMILRITEEEPALPLLEGMTIIEMTPGKPLNVEQAYMLVNTLSLLGVMEENDLYFKRVNFSVVVVKAYIYDDLYCEGTPTDITNSMGLIKKLVSSLYSDGITRGIIKVGKDDYVSFDPQIE